MIGPIQAFRAARAVVRITMDPTNLDEVFVLADLSEESARLEEIVASLRDDPHFGQVIRDKPRLGHVDQARLSRLPAGTLGREYASFMSQRGLKHDNLTLVEGESESDYLRNHLRETHDLWHVATGFDTDVAGELGLQAFYLTQVQNPLPVVLLAVGMLNTLFRSMDDVERRMDAIARGWLIGRAAAPLFGLRWADRWEQPLSALREELGIDLAGVDRILEERSPAGVLARAA